MPSQAIWCRSVPINAARTILARWWLDIERRDFWLEGGPDEQDTQRDTARNPDGPSRLAAMGNKGIAKQAIQINERELASSPQMLRTESGEARMAKAESPSLAKRAVWNSARPLNR